MGTLRSQTNHEGLVVNGVTLGSPVAPIREDGTPAQPGDSWLDLFWGWDDSAFPNGQIDAAGVVVVDEAVL